ncbi:MAG: OB-fold nucleic acid binding domain-containing protein, partial [Phycisphaerae bacterium]
MAGQYVKDLTAGQQVADQAFLVVGKQLRTARNGSKYVELTLSDRTGQLCARMWQASQQDFEQIPEGGFLRLTGRCESYKGTLQLIVDGFRPVEAGALEVADFLPQTGRDVEQMWQQMLAILRTIRNRWLLELIKQFVKD